MPLQAARGRVYTLKQVDCHYVLPSLLDWFRYIGSIVRIHSLCGLPRLLTNLSVAGCQPLKQSPTFKKITQK